MVGLEFGGDAVVLNALLHMFYELPFQLRVRFSNSNLEHKISASGDARNSELIRRTFKS